MTYNWAVTTIDKMAVVWIFGTVLREKGAKFREICSEKINWDLPVPDNHDFFPDGGRLLF